MGEQEPQEPKSNDDKSFDELFEEAVDWYYERLLEQRRFSAEPDLEARMQIVEQHRHWYEVARKPRAKQGAGLISYTWTQALAVHIRSSMHWHGYDPAWNEVVENFLPRDYSR